MENYVTLNAAHSTSIQLSQAEVGQVATEPNGTAFTRGTDS